MFLLHFSLQITCELNTISQIATFLQITNTKSCIQVLNYNKVLVYKGITVSATGKEGNRVGNFRTLQVM